MQYKTSFFLAIIGQFLTAFTSFWGISFIFNNVSSVDQFTYEEVLLCFAVVMMSFSIGEMFGGGLSVFPRLMRNGSFDRILTRPRSIIFQVLAGNTDFASSLRHPHSLPASRTLEKAVGISLCEALLPLIPLHNCFVAPAQIPLILLVTLRDVL